MTSPTSSLRNSSIGVQKRTPFAGTNRLILIATLAIITNCPITCAINELFFIRLKATFFFFFEEKAIMFEKEVCSSLYPKGENTRDLSTGRKQLMNDLRNIEIPNLEIILGSIITIYTSPNEPSTGIWRRHHFRQIRAQILLAIH